MEYLNRNTVSLLDLLCSLLHMARRWGVVPPPLQPACEVPWSKLAALTLWYETFFDVWHR